ncbi:MAG: TetR/AcrR family transcriptional regulator [Proteobacteria bacterium]|nr:TetR/AcrR family transcriptional regulator [Pseudomonadota bacterium]
METKETYHHGNLRQALLEEARSLIRVGGLSQLSMRKLAEQVGVSRTAAYHHFKDKRALLIAIAQDGFEQLKEQAEQIPDELSATQKMVRRCKLYLDLAFDDPALYELMYGKVIWSEGASDTHLEGTAAQMFKDYCDFYAKLEALNEVRLVKPPALIARIHWATLHGLARLYVDGVFRIKPDTNQLATDIVDMRMAGIGVDQQVE